LNYNGVFTDKFFVEGQYSERSFTFEHSGSLFTDRINGTLMVDRPTGFRYNAPTFCGVCTPEGRDNKNTVVKGSYFLSNDAVGAHDMVFGYDTFNDIRKANNHQSGSDFRILVPNTVVVGKTPVPQVFGTDTTIIQWNPILVSSQGTSFKTDSLFFNDKWRLNDRATFNIGVRYDKNDGEDSQGKKVAKDSRVSPRLAGAYDFRGDGEWVMNAGYSQYVTAIANTQADATSQGGNPATYQWFYRGPSINAPGSAFVPTSQVIQQVFNWFDSQGGTNNTSNLRALAIPGQNSVIRGSLASPYTQEISLGISKRLGNRGLLRADLVRRDSKDFYSSRTDLATGRVNTAAGPSDLTVIENASGGLQRQYMGLHTQFQYRFTDKFTFGGIYTLSELKGNVDGETAGSGPVSTTQFAFPEYADNDKWSNPKGDLLSDSRHRVRLWGVFDVFKNSHNSLNLTILQSYATGQPYGAVGAVDSRFNATTNPTGVKNPGYVLPPAAVTYYYTKRDAFRTDNISSTDLSLNYSFSLNGPFNKQYELFFEPEIVNLFNQHGLLAVNATVLDPTNSSHARFDPFTQTPVQGVNWDKGAKFGKANAATDYQLPRTFRFSVGVRF
jgi:TonB dependent receptor